MISNDHRSPSISNETLTGQPERGFDLGFAPTAKNHTQFRLQIASDSLVRLSSGILVNVIQGGQSLWRKRMKISVVVVNWNRRELLRACLASLAQQRGVEFEVIVV